MKTKQKFWRALEALADGATLADWKLELGDEFERAQPFLFETQNESRSYPCPKASPCECRQHRIEKFEKERRIAVCECGECPPLDLTANDLLIYELNKPQLAKAVAQACGWTVAADGWELPVWRLGRWDDLRGNLFWCESSGRERTRKIADSLLASEQSPFILLMPTAVNLSGRLDGALKREGCLALPLDEYLTVENDGKFRLVKSLETARQEFLERSAKRDTVKVLRGLEEKIDNAGAVIRSKGRAQATSRFLFRPAGSMCDVVFDGSKGFHIKNTDGAKYLDYLLHRPNQPIRAFDLERAVKPDKGQAREQNSIQKTVDSQAKREAREEMQELQAELEDAEAQGIIAKVKRLQGEIAKLKAVTENNSLLDSDTGERARDNVRKAISKVMAILRKGGKVEQSFAQHIAQFISLGYDIAYNQPKGNRWE